MTSYPSHEYIGLKPHEMALLPETIELLTRALREKTDEPIIRIDLWRRMMGDDDCLFVRIAGDKRFFETLIWPEESIEVIPLDDEEEAK